MHSPVFFITDVRLLRMELILPRSTLARLTGIGVAGVPGVLGVEVTGGAGFFEGGSSESR